MKDRDCKEFVRLIQTDVLGVSNARNIGIDEARGEFIAFKDDDDLVSPTYLEELLRVTDRETVGLSNALRYNDSDDTTQTESFSDEYKRKAGVGKLPYYNINSISQALA